MRGQARQWKKVAALFLSLLCAACVAVPSAALFTGEGTYVWQIRQPATRQMLGEIGLLFLLISGAFCLLKEPLKKLLAAGAVCLLFIWCHVVFLPMAVSGLYLGYVLLAGRLIREKVYGLSFKGSWMADLILGISAVLALFCLMSAAGIGGLPWLKGAVILTGLFLYGRAGFCLWKDRRQPRGGAKGQGPKEAAEAAEPVCRLLLTFTVVMVLIQVGRMNVTLDFDTLWYGVRSEYILDNGQGIYENPGMVGMAYVYAKGLEVLALPLCDLASHSYLLALNVWLAAAGLAALFQAASLLMERRYALLCTALVSAIPGIMNLSISAKPDIATWLVQVIMVYFLLLYLRERDQEGRRPFSCLAVSGGAYLLSLTLKSTALVFSTAVFGMAGLFLIVTRTLRLRAPVRQWLLLALPAGALAGIWARTMKITGMPVTSVFTSVFEKLGFQMKYPFASSGLPQNWQEASNTEVLLGRLFHMLILPTGEDMGHVVFAWGSPALLLLTVVAAVCGCALWSRGRRGRQGHGVSQKRRGSPGQGGSQKFSGSPDSGEIQRDKFLTSAFLHTAFWPFLAVNLVSLVMLYQVDGNYFMLLYTAVIVGAVNLLASLGRGRFRRFLTLLLLPVMAFNVVMTAESNWAWSLGFSEIQWLNKGRINHEALERQKKAEAGNEQIWNILAQDPRTRVIAFGDHPGCLQFPCVVQSYKDITSPWGNVELVNTPEAFQEYMAYAEADYAYVEAGFIGPGSWEWSYGLVRELIAEGKLTNLRFEYGNVLAEVDLEGQAGEESQENLRLFDENYLTYDEKNKQAQP